MRKTVAAFAIAVFAVLALTTSPAFAAKPGKNGTTLAGYQTIDICRVDDNNWRYSGDLAVWNSGAIDTQGLNITDFIKHETGQV